MMLKVLAILATHALSLCAVCADLTHTIQDSGARRLQNVSLDGKPTWFTSEDLVCDASNAITPEEAATLTGTELSFLQKRLLQCSFQRYLLCSYSCILLNE
jgi:hypothetical protein